MQIKEPTTYDEQLVILKGRNCFVNDNARCEEQLRLIGYYRLSGYLLPFKLNNNKYRKISLDRIINIYEFDSKLRLILLGAIEDIEISLRSRLSYYFTHKYGSTGYTDSSNFSEYHKPDVFKSKYQHEIDSNKSVLFVKHHLEKYNGDFPLWVLMELFTFGMLSFFYSDMKYSDRKKISHDFSTVPNTLSSWLRCCTDLRNICAHYGRLYYRIFSVIPAEIDVPESSKRKLWAMILCLRQLYPNTAKWNNVIVSDIIHLFEKYESDVELHHLAFPDSWKVDVKK